MSGARPLITVNGASFGQRVTGVQRYAREFTARLLAHPEVRLVLPKPALDFDAPGVVQVHESARIWRTFGAYGWLNSTLVRSLEANEVLWSPTVRAPLRTSGHVVTVHDMSVIDHPEWFRPSVVLQWRTWVRRVVRAADHIVVDSRFTHRRLIDAFEVDPARVTVVYCGVDERFMTVDAASISRVRARYRLPREFVLCVGSVDPRKNVEHVLAAWSRVHTQSGLALVLAGGSARTFARTRSAGFDRPGVVRLGYVDDADLPALYGAATAVAYPSVYEGFGLPPLEAMAAGTPVVALASAQAVAEVVGSAGVLVEDPEPAAFGDAVLGLIESPDRAIGLARRGRVRAAAFSWDAAAVDLLRVLRDPSAPTRPGDRVGRAGQAE